MISLKINRKSQLENWKEFIIQISIMIPISIFLLYKYKTAMIFYPGCVFYGIQFMFTSYVYLTYYLKNKGEEYVVSVDKIDRIKDGKIKTYLSSDIKKIIICKSANMDNRGIPLTTFEGFRIAKVCLKDGTFFIMTNLLEYDLEKPLKTIEGVVFERKKGFSYIF